MIKLSDHGNLIVFEGISGSGKSTLIDELKKKMNLDKALLLIGFHLENLEN